MRVGPGTRFDRIRIAFSICQEDEMRSDHVVGNPISPKDDFSILFQCDPGRMGGDPHIGLRIKINKEDKSGHVKSAEKDVNATTIFWYPGLAYDNCLNIEKFEHYMVSIRADDYFLYPEVITQMMTEGSEQAPFERLVCLSFISRSHVCTGGYESDWAKGLPEVIEQGLNGLFMKKTPRNITLWFKIPGTDSFWIRQIRDCLLNPFQSAVNDHRPQPR